MSSVNVKTAVSKFTKTYFQRGRLTMKKLQAKSEAEKREFAEELQRRLAQLKERLHEKLEAMREKRKKFSGYRFKGKFHAGVDQMSKVEAALVYDAEEAEYQSGKLVMAALSVAGVMSMRKIAKSAERISKQTEEVTHSATKLIGKLEGALHAFIAASKKWGGFIWKVALALIAAWVISKLGANALVAAVVSSVIIKYAPEIRNFVMGDGRVRMQAGTKEVSEFITMVCTCWVPGKDVKGISGEFMKRASNFPRAAEGIEAFLKKGLGILESFVNFVLRRSDDNRLRFVSETNAFEDWRAKTVRMMKFMAEKPKLGFDELTEIREHYLLGFGFYEILVTENSKRDLKVWMEKLALAIRPHEGCLAEKNNVRPLPYCCMFGGPSGAGKTSMLRYVASLVLLLSKQVKAKEALSHLWQKGTTEYWNGWVGQKCLVIDDAFQVKPKAGDMDSEAMQLIRANGNWAYPLNFADVESKGKFYLDIPLIIGTTNCKNVAAEWEPFVTCPKAITRRFQSAYWVEVNPEYANENGTFDYKRVRDIVNSRVRTAVETVKEGHKLTGEELFGLVPWDAWIIRPHDFNSNQITTSPDPAGLEGLIKKVAMVIQERAVTNEEEIQDIHDLLELAEGVDFEGALDLQAGGSLKEEEYPFGRYAEAYDGGITTSDPGPTLAHSSENHDDGQSDDVVLSDPGPSGVQDSFEYPPLGDDIGFTYKLDPRGFSTQFRKFPLKEQVDRKFDAYDLQKAAGAQVHIDRRGAIERLEAQNEAKYTRDVYKSMKDRFMGWLERLKCGHISIDDLLMIGSIGMAISMLFRAIIASVTFACNLVSAFAHKIFGKKEKVEEAAMQSNVGNGVKTRKDVKFEFATASTVASTKAELQVGTPPQEGARDKVYANTFKALVTDEDGNMIALGQLIGIRDDIFIFPKHYIKYLQKEYRDCAMTLVHADPFSNYKLVMLVKDFLRLRRYDSPTYDVSAVAFGMSGLRTVKSIVKLFLPQSDISRRLRGTNTQVQLQVCSVKSKGDKLVHERTLLSSNTCAYVAKGLTTKDGPLTGIVKYEMPTESGHCGAPLMLTESAGPCIFGFHSAGRTVGGVREGFGTIISLEVVHALLHNIPTSRDQLCDENEYDILPLSKEKAAEMQSIGLVGGSMYAIGELAKPVNLGTITKLKPSVMQEEQVFGPSPSMPAVLRPAMLDGEVVYPMQRGIEAYQSEQVYFDPKMLENVTAMAMKPHWESTMGAERTILSFEEAIVPPPEMKLKPLNRMTSPGYKYRDYVTPATPGKTFALGFEGEVDFAAPGLVSVRDDVQSLIHLAGKGIRQVHLCVDFLKDELRPNEKVRDVKTRVISGTPMDYTIAVRMYFGAFMSASFGTFVKNGMAPGINHYREWGMLAEALLAKGDKMFDGDFSRFDASEQPWVHEAILDYIEKWYALDVENYTPKDRAIRYVLWMDLVHSRHITGKGNSLDVVVQWNKSLPSGHPLTTIVNSMYSLITIAGCYVSLVKDFDMWDHAYVCTFGDDNITSVDDDIHDVFNQVTVAAEMKKLFNLDYTAGNKGGALVPSTDIQSVTFLKRSFRPDEVDTDVIANTPFVGWIAPLDLKSCLFEGYWYKDAKDPLGDLERRLNHMLCELALHPEEVWEDKATVAMRWAEKKGVKFQYNTRQQCLHYVKTRFDVWF